MIKPNSFQKKALIKLKECVSKGINKGLIAMPCRTGKTILSAFISENYKNTLFVVHDISVLEQAKKEYEEHFKEKYSYYTAGEKKFSKIIFATTQTLVKNLHKFEKNAFELIVIDEAHHYHAKTYKKIIDYFSPKLLLGLTGTPFRMDGKDLLDLFEHTIYEVDYLTAMKERKLSKFKYIYAEPIIDFNKLSSFNGKSFKEKEFNKKFCIKEYNKAIFTEYQRHKKQYGLKSTIIFCTTVIQLRKLLDYFKNKNIDAVGVWNNKNKKEQMYESERRRKINDFRKGLYEVLLVVNIGTEGLNIPECDSIIKTRPTKSKRIWIQQTLRPLTFKKDKLAIIIDISLGRTYDLDMNCLSEFCIIKDLKKYAKSYEYLEDFEIISYGSKIKINRQVLNIIQNQTFKNVHDAIREFKKFYGNKKPYRTELANEHGWIYVHFKINNLLEKYCKKSRLMNLELAIKLFKQIYGNKKPRRSDLEKQHNKIYAIFRRAKLIDKYCQPPDFQSLEESIKQFKQIYGNQKPRRHDLEREHNKIYDAFGRKKLLDKYCQPPQLRSLKDAINELKKIYGNTKVFRNKLRKEHHWIYNHFKNHKILDKYTYTLRNDKRRAKQWKKG